MGRRVNNAIERGRELHGWRGQRRQYIALLSEVLELGVEVWSPKWLKDRAVRLRSEAMDVVTVAMRLVVGR
jgi:hypothetical protein